MAITVNGYTYPEHFVEAAHHDGFSNNISMWMQLLAPYKEMDNLRFLELGTNLGRASVFLLDTILTGKNCLLDTVDFTNHIRTADKDGVNTSTIANLQPYIDNKTCVFHQKLTVDFFANVGNVEYDLIYVDASHEREDVLFDAVNSFFHLKENGVIIFDDYGWGECGQAIDSFLTIFSRKIRLISKGWQVVVQLRDKQDMLFRPDSGREGFWNDEDVKTSRS